MEKSACAVEASWQKLCHELFLTTTGPAPRSRGAEPTLWHEIDRCFSRLAGLQGTHGVGPVSSNPALDPAEVTHLRSASAAAGLDVVLSALTDKWQRALSASFESDAATSRRAPQQAHPASPLRPSQIKDSCDELHVIGDALDRIRKCLDMVAAAACPSLDPAQLSTARERAMQGIYRLTAPQLARRRTQLALRDSVRTTFAKACDETDLSTAAGSRTTLLRLQQTAVQLGAAGTFRQLVLESARTVMRERIFDRATTARPRSRPSLRRGKPRLDPSQFGTSVKPTWEVCAVPVVATLDALQRSEVEAGHIGQDEASAQRELWSRLLEHEAAVTYVDLCCDNLFDLVSAWPSATQMLASLKDCIDMTGKRMRVAESLLSCLEDRMLHPGTSTRSIVYFYVCLIRSLRVLDPSGVVLSHVMPVIRGYLHSRDDTVQFIVSSLLGTDPHFTLLRDELSAESKAQEESLAARNTARKGAATSQGTLGFAFDEQDSDCEEGMTADGRPLLRDYDDSTWVPRPIDAGPEFRQSRSADVVAMLVGIFADARGFVRVLEASFAEAILHVRGYDDRIETLNYRILEQRFGEAALGKCDIMLEDVEQSRKADAGVHALLSTPTMDGIEDAASLLERKAGGLPGGEIPTGLAGQRPVPVPSLWSGSKDGMATVAQGLAPAVDSSAGDASSTPQSRAALDALHPLVLSRQSWPDLEASQAAAASRASAAVLLDALPPPPGGAHLQMPGQLGGALEEYGRAYAVSQSSKRLVWLEGRGSVDVEVELDDGRSVRVEQASPLQAAIVEMASVPGAAQPLQPLTASAVVAATQTDESSALQALRFWTTKGVLRELLPHAPGTFVEATTLA